VATFGPGTGWAGKRITHVDGQFVLEDSGPVSAAQVLAFDRTAPLTWDVQGTRAWVGSLAQATSAATGSPAACFFDHAHYVAGPAGLGPAVDGRLWVTAEYVGIQVADGGLAAALMLAHVARIAVVDGGPGGSRSAATVRIGSLSLAANDTGDRTLLVAAVASGEAATYAVDRAGPDGVRPAVGPVLALAGVPFAAEAAGAPEQSMIDKIEKLAALNAGGVLSDDDFRARLAPVVTEDLPAWEAEPAPGPRPVPKPAVDAAVERLTAMRLAGSITDAELSAMKAKLLE
jgi:hypothetical protein